MSSTRYELRPNVWRTTAVRISVYFAISWILGLLSLNVLMFSGAVDYLGEQGDEIVLGQAQVLASLPLAALPERIDQAQRGDLRSVSYYGLFAPDGRLLAGNVTQVPGQLAVDGVPRELKEEGFQYGSRALAMHLAGGNVLVVGYNAKALAGLSHILVQALLWSCLLIVISGLGLGAFLGLGPMRRVIEMQNTSRLISAGDLSLRLPVSARGDELDMLSSLVNAMIEEVERLLGEVKSVGDNVAHDLRTPLNQLRSQLHRVLERWEAEESTLLQHRIEVALEATNTLLGRFRALQRIAEIDNLARRAAMLNFDLSELFTEMAESYQAVAEEAGIGLCLSVEAGAVVHADRVLLAEALINLLDNALKFTPRGGTVTLRLRRPEGRVIMEVEDNGPGIASDDREKVLYRFGRSLRDHAVPGEGLGLGIVSAVARLHNYHLALEDAGPGLRAVLEDKSRQGA